jgi:hypothetical protein
MEAERTRRIEVGSAGEAVRIRRGFGCHLNFRCNAGFVGNAVPAGLQASALIPSASPSAAARLISAPAPELEHVAVFSCDDRAGGIMPRLPFLERQVLLAFAHSKISPSRGVAPEVCQKISRTAAKKRGRRSAERRIQPLTVHPAQRDALASRRSTAALSRGFTPGWLNSRPCFLGLGSGGRYPPSPVPVQGKHLPHRP